MGDNRSIYFNSSNYKNTSIYLPQDYFTDPWYVYLQLGKYTIAISLIFYSKCLLLLRQNFQMFKYGGPEVPYVVNTKSKGKKNVLLMASQPPLLGVTKDEKKKPGIYKYYDYTKVGTDSMDYRMSANTVKTKSKRSCIRP